MTSVRTRSPRRKLSPRVKTKDKWRRIESLQRITTFEEEYRVALFEFRSGNFQVEFPYGHFGPHARRAPRDGKFGRRLS